MTGAEQQPSDEGAGERDRRGRFLRGNRTSRRGGNPNMARLSQAHEALRRAVSDDDLRDVLAAMVDAARNGDAVAARVVLERVLGRPRDLVHVNVDLPTLETAGDVHEALSRILGQVARGQLALGDGIALAAMTRDVGQAVVTAQLEARIAELEAAQGTES